MSGGSLGGSGTSGALQNYPVVPNSAGGAQASPAGTAPQAQSISQLQQLLQRMGQGGQRSPALQTANLGQQIMQMGAQGQGMRPQLPAQHPTVQGGPPVAPGTIPQMGGGQMNNQMTPAMMNMLLARQNGLMG